MKEEEGKRWVPQTKCPIIIAILIRYACFLLIYEQINESSVFRSAAASCQMHPEALVSMASAAETGASRLATVCPGEVWCTLGVTRESLLPG